MPVVAITGSKDVQILPAHAQKIAESVGGPAEWHVIGDTTYVLRRTARPIEMLRLLRLDTAQCREPIDTELLNRLRARLEVHVPRVGEWRSRLPRNTSPRRIVLADPRRGRVSSRNRR